MTIQRIYRDRRYITRMLIEWRAFKRRRNPFRAALTKHGERL